MAGIRAGTHDGLAAIRLFRVAESVSTRISRRTCADASRVMGGINVLVRADWDPQGTFALSRRKSHLGAWKRARSALAQTVARMRALVRLVADLAAKRRAYS